MGKVLGVLNIILVITGIVTLITIGFYAYYQIHYSNILLTTCTVNGNLSKVRIPPPNVYHFEEDVPFVSESVSGNISCGIDMCYLFQEYYFENKTINCDSNVIFDTNTTTLVWIPMPTVSQALLALLLTESTVIAILFAVILFLCVC
jgi:hypothetical protein